MLISLNSHLCLSVGETFLPAHSSSAKSSSAGFLKCSRREQLIGAAKLKLWLLNSSILTKIRTTLAQNCVSPGRALGREIDVYPSLSHWPLWANPQNIYAMIPGRNFCPASHPSSLLWLALLHSRVVSRDTEKQFHLVRAAADWMVDRAAWTPLH